MFDRRIFSLEDKVVLITGSGRGIGRAMALGFAEAGARVVINSSRNLEQGESTVQEIHEKGGQAIFIQADVSNPIDVNKMVTKTLNVYGRLDVLINNAGIVGGTPAEAVDIDEWQHILDVNLTGVFICCGTVAKKAMIPQRYGRIINVSSISAEIGHPGGKPGLQQAAYHASKGGVNILTRALALEWVNFGINVNSISPGWIDTGIDDAFFAADPANLKQVLDDTPMRRMGNPNEVVGTAMFLASEAASFITGQKIVVDGGYSIW